MRSSRTPPRSTKRWFGGKDHGQYMVAYHNSAKNRHSFSSDQLDDECRKFQDGRNQKEREDKENKWLMAIHCHETMMTGNDDSSLATRTILSKLCDALFRLEKNGRYISRVNFVKCCETATTMSTDDINSLYSAFDPMETNEVDWRVLVFMLHVAAEPSLSCKDILRCAFRFYVGNFGHVVNCPSSSRVVQMRDINVILDPLVRPNRKSDILAYFDEVWGNIMLDDNHSVGRLQSASTTLPFKLFERMLADPVIKTLHEESILVEQGILSFTVSTFEHDYYPAMLLNHVKKARRASAITKYLHNHVMAQKEACIREWRLYVSLRRHTKELVSVIASQQWNRQATCGFQTLRRWAICQVAATEIQAWLSPRT